VRGAPRIDRTIRPDARPEECKMERDQALKFMHDLLRQLLQKNGCDLVITSGFPPALKIDGKIVPPSKQAL